VVGAGVSTRVWSVLVIGAVLSAVVGIGVAETVICAATGASIGVTMAILFEADVSIILGSCVAAGVGTGVGVRYGWPLLVVIAMGGGVGRIAGGLLAHMRENELTETWEKLRKCKRELADCVNVVERCKEVLRKTEEELKELSRVLSELEQNFHRL